MKTNKRIAVYPGTFDPVTNGHLDLIIRAARLFDEVVVAVTGNSNAKECTFSVAERMKMLAEAVKANKKNTRNVRVEKFHGLLVNYVRQKGACAILRGLRAVSDFEYEFEMALMNRRLNNLVETVFLMPDESYTYLSSSLVKEVAGLGGNINGLVPDCVLRKLQELTKQRFSVSKVRENGF